MAGHAHARAKLVQRYGDEAVRIAEAQSEAERRVLGRPGRAPWEVLEGRPQRGRNPKPDGLNLHAAGRQRPPGKGADVLSAMLDGNGLKGAAALARAAAGNLDPVRGAEVRKVAAELEGIASGAVQLEFDLWGGGSVNLGHQFWDEARRRLIAAETPPLHQAVAQAVLAEMIRHLEFGSSRVRLNAAELAGLMRMKPPNLSKTLALLERIGAIWRVQRGRTKELHINPEGAFRGGPGAHQAAVLDFAERTGMRPPEEPKPPQAA